MEHVVSPLDLMHARAAGDLASGLVGPSGHRTAATPPWHITVASFEPVSPSVSRQVVAAVAARTDPFVVHAHGYGLFVGAHGSSLIMYVPVVRGPRLEALRVDLHRSLEDAGVRVAHWLDADHWTPHITLIDRDMAEIDVARLAAFVRQRQHPSWHVPVGELAVSTAHGEYSEPIALGVR